MAASHFLLFSMTAVRIFGQGYCYDALRLLEVRLERGLVLWRF